MAHQWALATLLPKIHRPLHHERVLDVFLVDRHLEA
jgi:hypothetical protein